MRKNTKILVISFGVACILFLVLTVVQSRLTQQEEKVAVFVAKADVSIDSALTEDMFEVVEVPAGLTLNRLVVDQKEDFIGKFAQTPIYQGQILFLPEVAEEQKLFQQDVVAGEEKVAIKLKGPENSISYQVKPGMQIQLYFTAQYGDIADILRLYGLQNDMFQENSLYTLRLLINEEVLGVFDEDGESVFSENFTTPDTIVLSVDANMAQLINNLRSQGSFDITV